MKILLPLIKKTGYVFLLTLLFSFVQKGFGQTTASATWSLTSNNNYSTTGNVAALLASSGGGLNSVGNSNTYGLNAIGWNQNNSAYTNTYFQYSIAPTGSNNLTISTMSFVQTTNTTGSLNYVIRYFVTNATLPSDATFYSSSTSIYSGTESSSSNGNTINVTGLNVTVASGYTMYVRIYAYSVVNNSGTIFGNKNFSINGTTVSNASFNTSVSSLAFGNQVSGSTSASQTFTLSGSGLTGYPGNIIVTAPNTNFQVSNNGSTWGSSTTIAYSAATLSASTIYVRFVPTTNAASSGNITITGGGAATPPSVAVSGTGTASQTSDIITDNSYTYTSNIAYANYQTASGLTASNSVGSMGLILRDGGTSSPDADNLPTFLTNISFSTGSSTAIRTAAIFQAGTKLAEVPVNGATSFSFSGLSLSASDNSTTSFELRVTYQTTVTDQQQIQFTVTSATANAAGSSLFLATNAGGASSLTTGSNNKIQVSATKLLFVQNTSGVVSGVAMSPSVTIKEVDANGNTDTHDNSSIALTTTGTFATTAITIVTPVAGVATFNNLVFAAVGNNLTLAGTSGSLTATGNSSTFNVTASQNSAIASTSGYVYSSPVLYANYQSASGLTTSNSVGAMGLTLQDGGGSADADNLPTSLTSITFSTNSSTAIRTAALFVSGVEVSSEVAVNGATSITFSGLTISAADNSNTNFELRVTYQSTVTDQQQIQFTVSSATASAAGSGFASSNAGGAASSVAGNNNRISVVATKLLLVQQPSNVSADSKMAPAVTIKEVDANNNIDTHDNISVSLTTSGTFTSTATTSATPSAGIATFSSLIFSIVGNGYTLTGAGSGLASATSSVFNVTPFVSSTSDYFITNASADWATVSTWQGSHDGIYFYAATAYPTSAATSVTVQNSHSIIVSTTVTISNLTINGSINVNGAGGNLTNSGTINGATSATLLINSGGTYTHALDGGTIPGALWNISSTCIVSGTTANVPAGLGQSFGNFTWSSNQSGDIALNSALKTVNGNFTYNSGSSKNLILSTNIALTLNIGNSFLVNGGSSIILTNGSASPVINVAGNLSITNNSQLDFADGSGAATVNLKGNYVTSGSSSCNETNSANGYYANLFFGNYYYNAVSGGAPNGTINFTGTNQTVSSTATGDLSNINFNIASGSAVTLLSGFAINNGPIYYNYGFGSYYYYADVSTFTISAGGTLITGTYNLTGLSTATSGSTTTQNSTFIIQAGGSIQLGSAAGITTAGTGSGNVQTAVRTFNAGANYTYNGLAAQVTGSGLSATLTGNLTINNTNSSTGVTISNAAQTVNGTLSIAAGSVITLPTATSTTTFGGVVNTNNSGVINPGTSSSLIITGTISNPLIFGAGTFTALTLNHTGSVLILGSALSTTSLNLTNGKIDASAFGLTVTGSSAIAGASSSNYVITGNGSGNGYLQINNLTAATSYSFPIGTSSYYLPASVNPATSGLNWSAKVYPFVTSDGSYNPAGAYSGSALSSVVNAEWDITPKSSANVYQPNTTGTITLNWQNALEGSVFSTYADNYIGISHYTSNAWQGGKANGGASNTTNYVTATFNSFSPFGIGSINNPLPVVLVDFNAELNSNKSVDVSWTTQQEVNSSHFEIERSADGIKWETIGTVEARGNSALPSDYTFNDASPLQGVNYYRLKMVNINNAYGFTTVKIVHTLQVKSINIFPNPARDFVNISVGHATSDLNIRLLSQNGQVLQSAKINAGSSTTLTIQVNNYPQGTYIIQISSADGTIQSSKFIIMR